MVLLWVFNNNWPLVFSFYVLVSTIVLENDPGKYISQKNDSED